MIKTEQKKIIISLIEFRKHLEILEIEILKSKRSYDYTFFRFYAIMS